MGRKSEIHQKMQAKRAAQREMQDAAVASVVPATVKAKVKAKAAINGDGVALTGNLPTIESLGIPRDTAGRGIVKGLGCLFNGQKKIRDKARFFPGNDARLTSLLVKVQHGDASVADVRPEAIAFLQEPGGMAGFKIENGRLIRTHAGKATSLNAALAEEVDEDSAE
jgi:hypothetical protein